MNILPGNMRFGFAPLYNRYVDVWDAVDRLVDIMDSGRWRDPAPPKSTTPPRRASWHRTPDFA